ncbi:hypothetical protein CcCBS67573_g02827 [Chytriomyces confervae]|uniref:Uncharacterized protein n=1 Tax=Chytriomyces confervae TaxID=246404 RepID=A0A507FLJ7_9FUNG|nr:vacuolar ATPase assembly integral membrane protein vma21 [Chytriomyces hyalinus]TPX75897.1 hypothetical protein CcCBS67573_g02827 [Chytriomyces confervae]
MSTLRKRNTVTPSTAPAQETKQPVLPASRKLTSNASPVIPASVLAKVAFFTVLMFTLPIGVYYATIDRLFAGESLYSAICAVVAANLVLVAYIVVAFLEDDGDQTHSENSNRNYAGLAKPIQKKRVEKVDDKVIDGMIKEGGRPKTDVPKTDTDATDEPESKDK